MKQIFTFLVIAIVLTSCSVTIPVRTSLSDQTMLFMENRNIKVNYTIASNIPDGFISYVSVHKNGSETLDNRSHKYAVESAFKKIWNLYFTSIFSPNSKNLMDIEVTLKDLKMREQEETSKGVLIVKTKVNIDALAIIYVLVNYQGKKYENQFEVNSSDFNELRQMNSGNFRYETYQKDQTELKAKLLEICLNKSVAKFENFLESIMHADKESL